MSEIELQNIEPLTVGATLKKRREKLGLTLSGLAEKTCIRTTFLQAMEDDRFDGFPGDAYLLGFLKLFAEALGLDSSAVIDQFRAQTGIPAGGREHVSSLYTLPVVVPRAKGRFLTILPRTLVFGALAFVAVFLTLYFWPLADGPNLADSPALSVAPGSSSLPEVSYFPLDVVAVESEISVSEPPVVPSEPVVPPQSDGDNYMLPVGGEFLRVEALGPVQVKALIDDHPLKLYTLAKDTVLSWRVLKFLQLQVDAPELLKVWLGNEPLELQGRSQLSLQAAPSVAKEGDGQ